MKVLEVETDRHGGIRIDGQKINDTDIWMYRGFHFTFTRACWLVADSQIESTKRKFKEAGVWK